MRILTAALITAVLFTNTAFADSSNEQRIVVTGSKFVQDEDEAVENVEVVDSEEIERSGAQNLSEALEHIPGIQVSGHNTDTISLQGFDGDYVKILIDGIEVAGDIGGATATSQIPVNDIKQIEVIRGASSALYGSDAMGGVINIITKKTTAGEPKASYELGQEVGTNLRTVTTGSFRYATPTFGLGISGGFDYDDGLVREIFTTQAGRIDHYYVPMNRLGNLRATADWFGENGEIGLFASFVDSKTEFNPDRYDLMEYSTMKLDGGVRGKANPGDLLSLSGFATAKYNSLDIISTDLRDKLSTDEQTYYADGEAEFSAEYLAGYSHTLLAGVNTKYQTIQGDSFEGLKHQAQFSLFAQDNWNVGGMDELRIVAGFRLDYAPALGEMSDPLIQATPKLSIRWDATPETIIRSSYGMGYKLPSLKQKYWTFNHGYGGAGDGNFILVGNPDLEPEKSHGVNLSVEQKIASDWTVSAAGYFNHIRDLIDSVEIDPVDGQNRRTYVNINKALTYGGDISIGYRPGDFSITGGYAYTGAKQWIENEAKYEDLPFRVPHKLSLQTVYRVPAWATEFSMSGSWNSPQLINQANNSYTPDLFMLNARISKDFGENFSLYLRGDNLLNNIHFINGTTGDSQTEYFELYDGFILTLGGRLRF